MTYSDVGSMELCVHQHSRLCRRQWEVGQGRNNLITVRGHVSCLMLQVASLQTLGGE